MAESGGQVSEAFKQAFTFTSFHSGFLKLAILKMVSERPMHGYALMKEIDRLTEHNWKPSPGSIYPALQELQTSGLICEESIGRRRVYGLTDQGTVVLADAVEHMRQAVQSLQKLLDYRSIEE